MAKKEKKEEIGKLSIDQIKKKVKQLNVDAQILNDDSSTVVREWIPTGSKLLDGSIKMGGWGGYPVGKITEIAGLESAGKSYLAAVGAANAQKMGKDVVWFDTEASTDPEFLKKLGINTDEMLYIQPDYLEEIYDVIQSFADCDNQMFFVIDSMAMIHCKADLEIDNLANGQIANKAKINAKLMPKIITQLNQKQHTLLIINQLKTNINLNPMAMLAEPWMTSGGKALLYAYSLRIWLTKSKSKALFVKDDNGFRVGSHVKAFLKKSRFGTEGRQCEFKLLWGDPERTGIMDEESWFEFLKDSSSSIFTSEGCKKGYYRLGDSTQFSEKKWTKILEDEKLRQLALQALEEELVLKFQAKSAPATQFYGFEDDVVGQPEV